MKKRQRFFGWLFLALLLAILLSPIVYWLTGIGQSAQELAAEIGRQPDGTAFSSPKAEALHRLHLPMRIERMVIFPLLLLSFQFSGGAVALRRWLEQRVPVANLNLIILLFFLLFEIGLTLVVLALASMTYTSSTFMPARSVKATIRVVKSVSSNERIS